MDLAPHPVPVSTPTQPAESPPPHLHLHAEYLPNIRQVSLQISVPKSMITYPEISLSESRRAVSVSVSLPEPVSETVKLPARVSEGSSRVLGSGMKRDKIGIANGNGSDTMGKRGESALKGRELSYRMQVDDDDDAELVQRGVVEGYMDSFVPWSAGDMGPFTKLRCRQCKRVLLDKPTTDCASQSEDGTVLQPAGWVWKDLPSGNWAEMMDFWHCHKPDVPKEHKSDGTAQAEDENSKVKGYGASNQVLANPGTVLVDVATFLVSDIECKGLKKASKTDEELICEDCGTLVGVEDAIAKGWRLFKTSLSAGSPSTEDDAKVNWDSHPAELVVAAQLLELIERESARRFIIHCGGKDGLLIWVFNPDMRYSNSCSEHSISSQRAMKVFFQATAKVEEMLHPEPGKTSSLSLEELRLPRDTFASLSNALDASNGILPQSARAFQRDWRVGILHRLERTKPT
ncbi:ubiquitin-conjugating enzyme E2-binding protein [Aspergillus cavernicola]|uniref:Ubiquitin-conjugating enzyme E2-binding protein n=1 Tax=Aspergillus cavernicola TaxID=176166 RepID=A0ABR4IQ85_9EURO